MFRDTLTFVRWLGVPTEGGASDRLPVGSSFNSKAVNKLTKPQTSNHHTKLRALKLKI